MVAKANPPMMVIAIDTKNASVKSGAIPRMVVTAASITGRKRDTLAFTIASRIDRPSPRTKSISSTRTMPFLISMPDRLNRPSKAVKVNGISVPNKPSTTPFTDMGTKSQIMMGWRMALNSSTEISTIISKLMGSCFPRLSCASEEFSNSPPHSILYPTGMSMPSIAAVTSDCTCAAVRPERISAPTVMVATRSRRCSSVFCVSCTKPSTICSTGTKLLEVVE
mmetsp:Transcript_22079/g.35139  ORF Transcript_22079/g.35139 Transcript_22079/m.35139 type:complete len:223 (-) Transcript_22079:184-852(-)